MATGIYSWSQTASSNSTADSTINWAEGQAPSSVNDSARAMMAILAKARDDWAGVTTSNGVILSGGAQDALTLTTNGSIAALTNGWTVTFRIDTGHNNTGSCTLNVDSTGAKQLRGVTGSTLAAGVLQVGGVYTATYYQPLDQWILHNYHGGGTTVTLPGSSTDNAVVRWNGTGGATIQNSIVLVDDSGNICPVTTDTGGLGTSSLNWSDLFLDSGAVINFDSGDVTITHSANTLTVAGGDFKAATLYDNTYRVGQVLLATGSASAGTEMDIALSSYTGFRGIIVKVYGCVPGTDGSGLRVLFSTDGGSTFISSGYNYARTDNTEGTNAGAGSGNSAFIAATGAIGSAAAEGGNFSFEILNQTSGTFYPRITWNGYYINSSSPLAGVYTSGGGANETGQDCNGLRFLMSSGTITASYAVYGLL